MRLNNVSAGYVPDQPVLESISLELEPGDFYFLTGPSGAGKSTLLSVLSLTHPPAAVRWKYLARIFNN